MPSGLCRCLVFPRRVPSRLRAFTLLEVLASIAIVSVLAALLIGASSKARENANTAKCLSNLRQIGVAANMFMAENNNCIPYTRTVQSLPWTKKSWHWYLAPYLGYTGDDNSTDPCPEVFRCPSAPVKPVRQDRTYMFNRSEGVLGNSIDGPISSSGEPRRRSRYEIEHPSTYVMVFDVAYAGNPKLPWKGNDTTGWAIEYDVQRFPPNSFAPYPRPHYDNKAVNLLFYDGHAARQAYPLPRSFYHWDA